MSWLVRAQADDFFNAYKVLNKNGLFVMTPGVVCLAFALELYIKDIYYALKMEDKLPRGRNGHNILKLYEGLPESVREEIFSHDAIKQNPFTTRGNSLSVRYFNKSYTLYERFTDQIKEISDGFEKWRYSFEKDKGTLNYESWFAETLIEVFISVADNARRKSAA